MSDDEIIPESKPSNPVRMDFDRLAAVFAVALSVAAILVSLLEVSAARDQQKSSVWPYVDIKGSYSEQGFEIGLTNKGVGPARLGAVNLLLDGKPVTDLDTVILELVGKENAFSYENYRASNPSFNVISRTESVNLFSVRWEPRTRLLMENWEDRVDINICYCSIYDECWEASLQNVTAKPVQVCEIG